MLAVALATSGVRADVTPVEVWSDWERQLQMLGYEVTTETATQAGGGLRLSEVTLSRPLGAAPDSGVVKMRFGPLTLRDAGDGAVAIRLPRVLPIELDVTGAAEAEVHASMAYESAAFEITATGQPGAIAYDYTADSLTLRLTGLETPEETPEIGSAFLRMEDLTGRTTPARPAGGGTADAAPTLTQSLSAGPVRYELDFTDPGSGARSALQGETGHFEYDGRAQLPLPGQMGAAAPEMMSGDLAAMLRAGFGGSGELRYRNGASAYRFADKAAWIEGVNASDSGRLTVALEDRRLIYDWQGEGMSITTRSSDLPFPASFEVVRGSGRLALPLLAAPEPQDFELSLSLRSVEVSESVWSLFDPEARLPRDAATVEIAISGNARLLADLTDAASVAALPRGAAAQEWLELRALSLGALRLDLLGASLGGQGAFTFNDGGAAEIQGLPAPEGALDLRLEGANALLDRLVAGGFLPQEMADGARLYLNLFAAPAESGAEDVLTSRIEVNEKGHVTANGQRLR